MSEKKMACNLPAPVADELENNRMRVQSPPASLRIWERLLSAADRRQLGDDFFKALARGGSVGMWMQVRGVSEQRAIIDLAKLLNVIDDSTHRWLLAETGEISDDPEEALEMALAKADLVVTESPRSVYWMGEQIDINWHQQSALWEYFVTLVKAAKQGRAIDSEDFGSTRQPDYHIKLKSRLTRLSSKETGKLLFPAGLEALIESEPQRRQKLNLAGHRICLLELVHAETVQEVI